MLLKTNGFVRSLLRGVGQGPLWAACNCFLRLYTSLLYLRLTFCKLLVSLFWSSQIGPLRDADTSTVTRKSRELQKAPKIYQLRDL